MAPMRAPRTLFFISVLDQKKSIMGGKEVKQTFEDTITNLMRVLTGAALV